MKLLLDHHYATAIAVQLRRRGHDVVAAVGRGWQAIDDESLLDRCDAEGYALLTNNVADFVAITGRWQAIGRAHSGIVFTSDASMPRGKSTIGQFVTTLRAVLRANPDGIADRVLWLQAPKPSK